MFIELRDGIVRLDPDTARDYAHAVMPALRGPARTIAAEFVTQLRRVTIPYRLIDHRVAKKREAPRVDALRNPCEYCGQPVPKSGLKFCGRVCYLRHSVEVRQPVKLAQAKLAALRRDGSNPGWDAVAREKREAGKAEALRKRAPAMTAEQRRVRRASQARVYRKRRLERARLVEGMRT